MEWYTSDCSEKMGRFLIQCILYHHPLFSQFESLDKTIFAGTVIEYTVHNVWVKVFILY